MYMFYTTGLGPRSRRRCFDKFSSFTYYLSSYGFLHSYLALHLETPIPTIIAGMLGLLMRLAAPMIPLIGVK